VAPPTIATKDSTTIYLHAGPVSLLQVLNWSFLALRGDFNMNLAMHEEPQQLRIRTELLQGSMMRRFSSSVGVTRTGPGACRLTMDLYMQPNVPVPFGIRHMVGHQVRAGFKYRGCACFNYHCFLIALSLAFRWHHITYPLGHSYAGSMITAVDAQTKHAAVQCNQEMYSVE
jgi:hypothetical protein